MTSNDRLNEIRQRANNATPGPWGWFGNVDTHRIDLATKHSGRQSVMDFTRWGMKDARPRFQYDGLMVNADQLATYEVAPTATSRKDPDVYWGDIVGFRHPDAQFIAQSRADVDFLLGEVDRLKTLAGEADQ